MCDCHPVKLIESTQRSLPLISVVVTIILLGHLPKPERTHHCSVCKKCVLKYDHVGATEQEGNHISTWGQQRGALTLASNSIARGSTTA